jgi:hypothetical protein
MLPLAVAAVQKVADVDSTLDATAAALLFQLDAARALGPSAVVELLAECIAHRSPQGVLLVALLPAASQLDQQACEDLVAKAVQRVQGVEPAGDDDSSSSDVSDDERVEPTGGRSQESRQASISVLCSLLQQPAVQQLNPAAAVRLMSACLKLQPRQPLLLLQQVHSQLPAAQQAVLGSERVKQLMHTAFVARAWDAFDWLKALPAAPLDDETVTVWCNVTAAAKVALERMK